MRKCWILGCLALVGAGCGEAHVKRPPVEVSGLTAQGCPGKDTVVSEAACSDLPPEYGLRKDRPVEWGMAGGPVLYAGRLLCADGSPFERIGRGSVGPAGPTSSPPADFTNGKPLDIIDQWTLRCGDQTIKMYSNMYRCGSPCVPAPFRLLAPAAHEATMEARRLGKEEKHQEALVFARAAVEADPASLLLHVRLAYASVAAEKAQEGVEAADQGLARFPGSHDLLVVRSYALEMAERFEDAYQGYGELLADEQLSTERRPVLTCRKAAIARKLGKMEEFETLRVASCEAGFKPCCQVPPPAEE